ncbi:dephospho-CoA kinase [Moellerella wisconsensis]|uniref:Dephospho-CoA kinase n=1 Tax=Moellerella wisconsensis TaxID=158849 RepID=A0A9Q8V2K2_9GAMM|nr:dephospho-CoA kinase [Moellerella wisconsensis]KLN96535.1 dephospho-CoA kinase [Moellerella wisconsensis]UNH23389.1 dephospho-CoA kinase [Moellerella wisconsensis]UNH29885.1 dephospho-CoA kinase [Moellerella wisconsensis]WJW81119.1 dephospho-CoA kinase [Moellerella wisconsensis]
MAYIVALTGGIGSGKTTIANAFAALGVPIVDADIISRQVVEAGSPALAAIAAHFGQDILLPDSTLNRPLLRHKIFSDPQQKAWLNALLHPLIQQETQRQLKNTDALYLLWVVPLLIENNISHLADRVLVVDVTPEEQIQRTITRDNITRQHVERIIAAQASRAERLSLADDIISNHDGEHQQQDDIVKLHQKYQQLAKQAQQENAK